MSHTNKKYVKRLMTPEERWKDVADDARVVRDNANIIANIDREINKVEGYIIWHMDDDKYLSMDDDTIGWDTENYSLISEEDMKMLQEILYRDSISKRPSMESFPVEASGTQLDLYHAVVDVVHLQVVPCVKYEGEKPQFDYVNAFRFDRAEQ